MKITVIVKPNAKEEKVEKIDANSYKIFTKQPAKENKANIAVVELLSEYFHVPKRSISIIQGVKSKHKIIEIIP